MHKNLLDAYIQCIIDPVWNVLKTESYHKAKS